MSKKRLRIFAGPNGSGKTSIIKRLKDKISFGNYINADDIEYELNKSGYTLPNDIKTISNDDIISFIQNSDLLKFKLPNISYRGKIQLTDNKIYINTEFVNSYIAAVIADYLREKHITEGLSFTFETVLSHPSKIDLIKKAKQQGFRIYIYYISTESPEINVRRVQIRVAQNGHPVPEKAIRDRFVRTMNLLPDLIKSSDRAFLFDNSGAESNFFAEITDGTDIEIKCSEEDIPNWFFTYVIRP